ncbi:MAG: hypothetical protein ACI9O4_002323 [Chitinophagales bacterium]|jgi:hypothetical protein
MQKYVLLGIFSLLVFGVGLQSCSKHTCPTYATSSPTKGVKKKIKKSRAAYSKKDQKSKSKKGKAVQGLDG